MQILSGVHLFWLFKSRNYFLCIAEQLYEQFTQILSGVRLFCLLRTMVCKNILILSRGATAGKQTPLEILVLGTYITLHTTKFTHSDLHFLMLLMESFNILTVLSTVTIICLKIPDFAGPGGHLKSNIQYSSNN